MRHLLFVFLLALSCQPDSQPDPAVDDTTRSTSQVHAIVDASQHQLFGAGQNGGWLAAEQAAEFVHSDQRYRVYSMTDSIGVFTAVGIEPSGETCTNPAVHLQNLPEKGPGLIGVDGPWNALPRVPVRQDATQQVYRASVADYLQRHNIDSAEVELDQVLRIDLEGDGTDEVLIAANRLRGSATMALPGDYALVLLRKVVDSDVYQVPLEEEYYPDGCVADCAPSSFEISAVLDVNGDGVMEVVTRFQYFEGRGRRIHVIDRTEVRSALSWRCGA